MKEIYLITSYTPTLEKQDTLRNLINSLYKNNKKICLVSHTPVPQDIIERVNYYFYDEENNLDLDSRFFWKHYNSTPNFIIHSRTIFPSTSTFLPVLRLAWFGVKICKFLGYEVVHQLEYDTHINNFTELDKNTNLLKEYDCVLYSNKRSSTEYHIQGSYLTINPQKIDDSFFTYNEKELKDNFVGYNLKVENFSFDNYYSKLNFIKKPIEDLEQSLTLDLSSNEPPESLYFTLIFSPDYFPGEEWFWYVYSTYSNNETWRHFDLVINDQIHPLGVRKWGFGGISKDIDLKNVKFIYKNKVVVDLDMKDNKTINQLKDLNEIKKKL